MLSSYPFPPGFKVKQSNLPPELTPPVKSGGPQTRWKMSSISSQQCNCKPNCVSGRDDLKKLLSTCPQANSFERNEGCIHVVECTIKNCSFVGDCGNKYRPTLTQWHAHKTVELYSTVTPIVYNTPIAITHWDSL
jgi:hypothetical protein